MHDELGTRMKENYEDRTRIKLPRRTNTIIRLDGKAFHTFTRGCKKPFDIELMDAMDYTAKTCCEEIQGAKFAFVQSDEISILLTDYDNIQTDAWFDGNVQKMVSVAASIATGAFIDGYVSIKTLDFDAFPQFDARVFTIPDKQEVVNYFVWRQQDATRNSISMAAQSIFSHKELNGKSSNEQQEMLFQKGINWNDYPDGFKRGRSILKKSFTESHNGQEITRNRWAIQTQTPIFTQYRDFILSTLPQEN